MLRKTICILMILMFFIGFILVVDVLALGRPDQKIRAIDWEEGNVRILPDYGTDGEMNDSQLPTGNEESGIGGDGESCPLPQEFERAIKEWSDFLYLRIKGIIRR